MKLISTRIPWLVLGTLTTLTLVGCGGGGSSFDPPPVAATPEPPAEPDPVTVDFEVRVTNLTAGSAPVTDSLGCAYTCLSIV